MKFVLESVSKCSGRMGMLNSVRHDKALRTPLFLYLNPQISRENLELSGFDLSSLAISLPISNIEQMEKAVNVSQKRLSSFVGLDECLTFVTLRNSSDSLPSGSGYNEKGSVPIFKKAGKINITAERYMDMIETFKPDIYTTLSDGDTCKESSKKRVVKAVERSIEFHEECVKRIRSSGKLENSMMITSLEGGYSEWERKAMLEKVKDYQDITDGYFIDGLHRNGHEAASVDPQAVKDIVNHSMEFLPNEKVKIMMGGYSPNMMLELISLGIDIFDSSFVNLVTNSNRAMVFNFDLNNPETRYPEIDLLSEQYKDDFGPFVKNCQCLACTKHTRAYCNHLLITHELLGPMLLTIHNLHHYQKFFEAIRKTIADDKLPQLIKLVEDQYAKSKGFLSYELAVTDEKPEKLKEIS